MKPTLLCYRISTEDSHKLKSMLALLNFEVILIQRTNYLQPIGYLAGLAGYNRVPASYKGSEFAESMLIMANLKEAQADQLLTMLKMPGMPVFKRKVMLTDTNRNWTSVALYEHISKEIAALRSSN